MTSLQRLELRHQRPQLTGQRLSGYAAVYNQPTLLGSHYEQIAPGAFDRALRAHDTDVRALLNHNPDLLLGRQSSGTLRLTSDRVGLRFEVDLPDTGAGRDARQLVARGDLTGASFAFIPGIDEVTRRRDGKQLRTHTMVASLRDISIVTYPAYSAATVNLRDGTPLDARLRELRARFEAKRPKRPRTSTAARSAAIKARHAATIKR
jgi:hypothetical protein